MYSIFIGAALLLFSILAWRDIRLALFIIAAALPTYLLRLSPLTVPTTVLELLIVITFFIAVVRHGKKLISLDLGKWRNLLTLFLVAASFAVLVPKDPASALGIWKSYFIEPVLVFWMIATFLKTAKDRNTLLIALGASSLFVSTFGIIQYFTGLALPIPWDIERRITSIYPFPNAVGLFLGPIVVIAGMMTAWVKAHAQSKWQTYFWMAVAGLGFLALIFAESEAAIGSVMATLFIASLFWKEKRRFTIPLAIIGTILLLIVPAFRTPFVEKVTLQDYSGTVRTIQWDEAVDFLKDHPLLGAGLNGYPEAIVPYHSRTDIEIFQYPHNIVLNIWVELGLLGLLVIALLATQIIRAVPTIKGRGIKTISLEQWIAIAAGFALLETVIHGIVDVPYFKNDLSTMTWIFIALIFLSHVPKQIHSTDQKESKDSKEKK